MQVEELRVILEAHELWLSSNEQNGERADLSNAILKGVDLSGAILRGAVVRGAVLDGVNLSGAQLLHADFKDAQLRGANLEGANLLLADFAGADLSNARLSNTICDLEEQLGHVRRGPRFKDSNLEGADLRGSILYMSDLTGSNLLGASLNGAVLEGANLSSCILADMDLRDIDLSYANLQGTDLSGASLIGANLVHADLRRSTLSDADVCRANLQSATLEEAKVDGIRYNRETRFRGIRAFNCYGSSRFRRFAQDQDYLEEFKAAYPAYYWIWLMITDCGRSMMRVVFWSMFFIGAFGVGYFSLGEQAFAMNNEQGLGWTLFTTTYYSVVTFTTLGFGDITPNTTLAACVVMIEVVVGYVMLGILISILATKVARRS